MIVIRCTGASGPGPGRAATVSHSNVPGSRPPAFCPLQGTLIALSTSWGARSLLPADLPRPSVDVVEAAVRDPSCTCAHFAHYSPMLGRAFPPPSPDDRLLVPPELLVVPHRDETRRLDRWDCAYVLDPWLRAAAGGGRTHRRGVDRPRTGGDAAPAGRRGRLGTGGARRPRAGHPAATPRPPRPR